MYDYEVQVSVTLNIVGTSSEKYGEKRGILEI